MDRQKNFIVIVSARVFSDLRRYRGYGRRANAEAVR